MDLTELTISEAGPMLARGEISPVELAHACLERTESLDPHLNCFITCTAEAALASARQAEREIREGSYRGPLHGIPMALKDLYETRGIPTTAGSKVFAGYIPENDGFVVRKLKDAGIILLGKLNMHEIALGVTNENPHYGPCNNPWDIKRISGGSSGGSAAALAAGLCLGSLGSDTGGSIRIPSSLCGVVGLKPTFGRVSMRGVIPLSWNLDHPGPMARSVRDVALLLQEIAGYDPDDPSSAAVPVHDYFTLIEAGVRGWQVALAVDEFFSGADDDVLSALHQSARVFEELGAQVSHVSLPEANDYAYANGLMVTSDAAAYHRQRMNEKPEEFGADVLQRLQAGAAFTSTEYVQARRTQSEARRRFELFFEKYDLLLVPSTPVAAPLRASDGPVQRARQLTRFTAPFNLSGLPALSLPCGFTAGGMPLGLQVVTRPWAEAAVLRAAFAYEQATPWHLQKPEWPVA